MYRTFALLTYHSSSCVNLMNGHDQSLHCLKSKGRWLIVVFITICGEPAWPSGNEGAGSVSRQTSVWFDFSSPLSSNVVVCGHCPVTLSVTVNDTVRWFTSLPIWMQNHSGGDSVCWNNSPLPPLPGLLVPTRASPVTTLHEYCTIQHNCTQCLVWQWTYYVFKLARYIFFLLHLYKEKCHSLKFAFIMRYSCLNS